MAEPKKQSTWDTIQKHMMSGIGYMIPLIMGYTVVKGLFSLIGVGMGIDLNAEAALTDPNVFVAFMAWFQQVVAPACQNFMYPVFAGYLAYSVGQRSALIPGFVGGLIAQSGGSGFIGALAIGFATGYFMKWLTKTVKVSRTMRPAMNLTFYPAIGSLVVCLLMYLVINPVGSAITAWLVETVAGLGVAGAIPFAAVIAGMMAFDCGGPVNKAAFTTSITLMGTGVSLVPLFIGCKTAPIGQGFAWVINRVFYKGKALPDEVEANGLPALIMGIFSCTEGALPAALYDPAGMIPINVIGSIAGAIMAELLGVHFEELLGFGFLCDTPLQWLASLCFGALVIGVLTCVRMNYLLTHNKKDEGMANDPEGAFSA